ncbi:putative S-adenosylmethionine-dependent methyltransferase [Gemmata sp. SH-PL17]|uniref:class I SAM-dependent methyltransferase n=1 Tax=Gemmata sp. SH-PL17 TaxID=1630693 RepID=UPI00078C5625|nr:class I SAM-dependent methyltransferase [Gemmata sp. SH-PL17]AMV25612.1 putative S-adenosylmethionine-dependent methyltransferase [Gemmata sp. SH-PL17]
MGTSNGAPVRVEKVYEQTADILFAADEIALGPWTSYSLVNDPKHMCFVLSRYKFVAKLLQGKKSVLEVGAGDGFGLPIVAQAVPRVYALDWDPRLVDGNARRLAHLKNVTYLHGDINTAAPDLKVDAAYTVDVIEHVDPAGEARFVENIVRCLPANGVLLTGTPNVTSAAYASPQSQVGHINLKSMATLRELMERYFENVFMFGMNDEVVHTGYAPMCHYIWALAVGVRPGR